MWIGDDEACGHACDGQCRHPVAAFGQLDGEQPDGLLIVKKILWQAPPRCDPLIRLILVLRIRSARRGVRQIACVLRSCQRAHENRSTIKGSHNPQTGRESHDSFDAVRTFGLECVARSVTRIATLDQLNPFTDQNDKTIEFRAHRNFRLAKPWNSGLSENHVRAARDNSAPPDASPVPAAVAN